LNNIVIFCRIFGTQKIGGKFGYELYTSCGCAGSGRITIADLVSGSEDAKERYQRAAEAVQTGNKNAVQVIVYDQETVNFDELPANSPLRLVVSCLVKTGFDVYYMFGELSLFHDQSVSPGFLKWMHNADY